MFLDGGVLSDEDSTYEEDILRNFYEEPECDEEELSKLFVEDAEAEPIDCLLLPER
jgi:hypothetical protein